MDPNYVNEEEEAAAMAAMMGFSGFGSQKPLPKKRKFTTDAFVEGQDVMSLDRGGKKGQGSGGNTTPLGKSRVFGTGSSNKTKALTGMNEAEIELGDEDEEETEGPQYVDTSLPPPIISGSEGAPQYVDTSQPPPASVANEEAREVQSRIDDILASIEFKEPTLLPAPGTEQPHVLPQRPNFSPPNASSNSDFKRGAPRREFGGDMFNDSASTTSSRPSHRIGPRNENWYLDYYDPSFNQNPWDKLEKEKGLEPVGSWP